MLIFGGCHPLLSLRVDRNSKPKETLVAKQIHDISKCGLLESGNQS